MVDDALELPAGDVRPADVAGATGLDDGGAHQQVASMVIKIQHDLLELFLLHLAMGNTDAGKMKKETRDAIVKAGNAILAGKYHDQFLVDPYQGGAGTSTNMAANEIMANAALLEIARAAPRSMEELSSLGELRRWQLDVVGPGLLEVLGA